MAAEDRRLSALKEWVLCREYPNESRGRDLAASKGRLPHLSVKEADAFSRDIDYYGYTGTEIRKTVAFFPVGLRV